MNRDNPPAFNAAVVGFFLQRKLAPGRVGDEDYTRNGPVILRCALRVRDGSRLCENPIDAMIPLLNRGGG